LESIFFIGGYFWREHDPDEGGRDVRNDREVEDLWSSPPPFLLNPSDIEDPLRAGECHLDDPNAFVFGIASSSALCGRGPRVIAAASLHLLSVGIFSSCVVLPFFFLNGSSEPEDEKNPSGFFTVYCVDGAPATNPSRFG